MVKVSIVNIAMELPPNCFGGHPKWHTFQMTENFYLEHLADKKESYCNGIYLYVLY